MIIQLSITLSILGLIRRHVQKQFAYTPSFVISESHMFVITHAESGWSRTWLPAQPLGVGGKSLSWMGHGNCTSMLAQVMKSCGANIIMTFLS